MITYKDLKRMLEINLLNECFIIKSKFVKPDTYVAIIDITIDDHGRIIFWVDDIRLVSEHQKK